MSTALQDATRQESPSMLLARLRASFEQGRTRNLVFRREQLAGIVRFLKERERDIEAALHADMGRPCFEVYPGEIAFMASEAALASRKLRAWARPKRVATALAAQPGRSWIYPEPLGVVLIIGAWNYPLQLLLVPLVGALAAGNCAVLKPSEVAPATSALAAEQLPKYLDPDCVAVVEGGVPVTTALLTERFDYIFYTGSGTVARVVMQAAAEHLTPVTLELGGKSPCIVDRQVAINTAARRIAWGKFFNAGQTCVAPDYILAHEAIEETFSARLKQVVEDFFGPDPRQSPDFGRIVSAPHHRRLTKLLDGSGEIFAGGQADEDQRYIAPTILRNVPPDARVMSEEIFGPILPVLKVKDMGAAISFVNARPKPLALYVFTHDREVQRQVLERTSSGGVTVNHTMLHLTVPALPFGGVGPSGMGAYHGRASFETFSHRKSVLEKPVWPDLKFIYPPYDDNKRKWVRRLI
jgi:aldehyde dehydrogenase (NAD+)